MKKITILLGLAFGLLPCILCAQTPQFVNYSFNEGINLTSMSDNGQWAVAKGTGDETTIDANPYLLNNTDGTTTKLLTAEELGMGVSAGAYDVTDDGKTVVGTYNGSPARYTDGKWEPLTGPDGEALTGMAQFVSPDGRFIAGTVSGGATPDGLSIAEEPAFWENGVYVPLANLPEEDAFGENKGMSRIISMSADGNIFVVCLSFSYPGSGACCYVYNRETQESTMLGKGKLTRYSHVDEGNVSPNGKWVTGMVHEVVEIEGTYYAEERDIAYLYNVETKELTLYDADEDTDIRGTVVTNDGTVLATSPAVNPVRSVKIRAGQFWYDLELVLKQKYGVSYGDATGYSTTGLPVAVSTDGKTMAAMAYIMDENYVLTLPETFAEAAASVNLLAGATIFPNSGSSFAQLNTVTVSFDRAVKPVAGAKATLYKMDGTAVRSSMSIAQGDTERSYVFGFRPVVLDEGTYYKLVVPAGSFEIEGTDMTNEEMSVTYIGRANRPVELFDANPYDGSSVSELSYNSPIIFDFDMQVKIASGASAELYQEGAADPICKMPLSESGTMVAAYPSTVQYLYKGMKYIVKVPAASVTDIMGNNPNEEFSITYTGLYERPLPEPGENLFFEDFTNPSNAYNSFMLYDGDQLKPTAGMVALGFDSSNTPWNFTLRGEGSYDYCAASTSCYSPAGTSDDWMTTIQLNIPSEKYYLTWKSQSYKANKTDRLRVVVWTSDEVLSVLTKTVVDRMKAEGVEVYNGVESIGQTEEQLADEWTEHRVSLDPFIGKNIYISFVNDNTDQSLVFVDDVKVAYEGIYAAGNTTEKTVVQQSEVEVGGYVRILDEEGVYNTLKVSYADAQGNVQEEKVFTDLGLKEGDTYRFAFDRKLAVEPGRITGYNITVDLEGDVQQLKGEVRNLAFVPEKRVVIEKLTGAWCSNCPLGIVAFEYLEKSFPDNFIPIAIHTSNGGFDPYDFSEYAQFLGLSAAPTGLVNRIDTVYSPLNTSVQPYSYVSDEGNQTFTDILLRELREQALAKVEMPLCVYDPTTNQIAVRAEVTYALDVPSANYNIGLVLLENGRSWKQTNGFTAVDDPILGEWGRGGAFGASPTTTYDHMARAVIGSYIGAGGYIPASVTAGETYVRQLLTSVDGLAAVTAADSLDFTKVYMGNASLVCLLINANTGRIENAAIAPFVEGTVSGVGTASAAPVAIRLTQDGTQLTAHFPQATADAMLQLYAADGTLLDAASAQVGEQGTLSVSLPHYRGLVIAKAQGAGQTATAKFLLR